MGRQGLTGPPWWVAVVVVAADQITKVWAVAALEGEPVSVIGEFLELRLTRNPGAAFSSFTGGGRFLAVVAILIVVVVAVTLPQAARRFEQVSLALILGGAVGNLLDRFFRGEGILDGAVVDFIDLSFWPTFNVADSAISVGVVVLILGALFAPHPRARVPSEDA